MKCKVQSDRYYQLRILSLRPYLTGIALPFPPTIPSRTLSLAFIAVAATAAAVLVERIITRIGVERLARLAAFPAAGGFPFSHPYCFTIIAEIHRM